MSRFQPTENLNGRISFASRTAFDALAVEEGEDTDEEILEEIPPATVDDALSTSFSTSTVLINKPVNLNSESKSSKTASKKAAKAARQHPETQKKTTLNGVVESSNNDVNYPTPHDDSDLGVNVLGASDAPSDTAEKISYEAPFSAHQKANDIANENTLNSTGSSGVLSSLIQDSPLAQPSHTSPITPQEKPQSTVSKSLYGQTSPFIPHSDTSFRSGKLSLNNAEEVSVRKEPNVRVQSSKKIQNMLTRTLWTFIMISVFLLCLALGHAFMIILVMGCATLVYREITQLFTLSVAKSDDEKAKGRDPWSKTFNWYFFAVTNYFLYGESLIYYFKHVVFADAQLLPFATNHRFISFMLYTLGFVGFVTSLQKQYLKSQFGLFCWVHMTLMVIVVSSHFIINNILEGLIWFWVPASLVICNDVFAYVWGITFGRTPLIKLSPKKTVEGFVGAFFSTVLFGLAWGTFFMRFDYMICPAHNLGVSAFSSSHCNPNPVFIWREWELWAPLRVVLSTLLGRTVTVVPYATYQFHLLIMSCFASLVAPFGGFFASGFKRAFDIKDFGDSIPGHGGMTDRMDCQFLMGVFTYVYYSSLIKEHHDTVGSILQTIVSSLTLEEQLELIRDLQRYLEGKGVHI